MVFIPTKLSMAMINAFKGLCGRATSEAAARRTRIDRAQTIVAAPMRTMRRVEAFFVAQKVNGRNAP